MSVRVIAIVWERSQHKASNLLVLLAMADFAHDDGTGVYPSVPTLAQKARISDRNVQYALRDLGASGEIESVGRSSFGTTIYRIRLEQLLNQQVTIDTDGGENFAPPGANDGAKSAPKQSVNRVNVNQRTSMVNVPGLSTDRVQKNVRVFTPGAKSAPPPRRRVDPKDYLRSYGKLAKDKRNG